MTIKCETSVTIRSVCQAEAGNTLGYYA
jgi:hypothetical protein